MKIKLNNKLSYSIYAVLLVFFSLTSCNTIEEQRQYDKRSWEIKQMRLELEYLKLMHEYKRELEIKQKIADIDSFIQNYHMCGNTHFIKK